MLGTMPTPVEVHERTRTAADLREEAETLSRRAGYASATEAFDALEAGTFRYRGSILASRLSMVRFLLGEETNG